MGDGFWCFMCLYIRFINGECIRSSFLSWVVRKMFDLYATAMLCEAFCHVYNIYTVTKYFTVTACSWLMTSKL